MQSAAPTPRVHVISLGGTIASSASDGSPVAPEITGAQLVAAVPQLRAVAEVTTEQLAQVGSPSLDIDTVRQVAIRGAAAVADGARGVVITQGTDTLEETAYLLSLLNDTGRPFVATGAMRNPTMAGADGPANLLAAVSAAASDELVDVRALLAFNDELHDPLWVRKSHTASTATFTSAPQAGPMGWLHEGEIRLGYRPATPPWTGSPSLEIPPVALVSAGLGEDLRLVEPLPDLGYAGVVIAGTGGGHVHQDAVDRVTALAQRVPVVIASRTGSGQLLRRTYGFRGGEVDLLSRGLLSAGGLSAPKARLLLGLMLAHDAVADWPY
ncbi:asparaginase [Cumulibacter soli]|uniref:asparaginase n=1 Tax=Cumulibacter soli TaxID=2546344 RepID=UPI001067316F|nr:asparaginase [Cumulibacter soli]